MVASHDYIENLLAAFDRAGNANRQTPGRKGNIVTLDRELAEEVIVTGDLHGNRCNFNRIRGLAALDQNPRRHLVLQEVCHGGPIYPQNGGCMSHAMLEDVAGLKTKYPDRVHFILGNHELSELTDFPIQKNRQMLNLQFRLGMQQMYGPAAEKIHEAYCRFWRTCPLAVRLSQGVFISHSVPEYVDIGGFDRSVFDRELTTRDYDHGGAVFQLVWGRDYRGQNARAFAELVGVKVLVNGHEPCSEGFIAPNDWQIILDCCGQRAAYVVLPIGSELSHAQIMERVQRLDD